ncbi:MAG: hypothetical protein AAF711_01145 [Planctomycetota bacterium]
MPTLDARQLTRSARFFDALCSRLRPRALRLRRDSSRIVTSPIEPLEPRMLFSGSLDGNVQIDTDPNDLLGVAPMPAEAVVVFLDADQDGQLDAGETQASTDASGAYSLGVLADGTHHVQTVIPAGYLVQGGGDGSFDVVISGQDVAQDLTLEPTDPYPFGVFNDTVDFGSSTLPGNTQYDTPSGTYTIEGGGAQVWNKRDYFHFARATHNGDGVAEARVVSLENTDPDAKAGLMFRNDAADSRSANVFLLVKPDGEVALQRRGGLNWSTETVASVDLTPGNRELRLERSGELFTAFYKDDSGDWQLLAATNVPIAQLGADAQVGLGVSSGDNTQLATAVFDQVTMPWSPSQGGDPGATADDQFTQSTDIGSPTATGQYTHDAVDDYYVVYGGGAGIGNSVDEFQFVYETHEGNGSAYARVAGLENTDSSARAGIMFRESADADAAYVLLTTRPDGDVMLQWRSSQGGTVESSSLWNFNGHPRELNLTRIDSTFYAHYLNNQGEWQSIGYKTINGFADITLVGLAVTSADTAQTATAVFDRVHMPWSPTDHGTGITGLYGLFGQEINVGGNNTLDGETHYDAATNTYNVQGGGWIGYKRDYFQYAYATIQEGDGVTEARVVSLENTHPDAKAGIMFRDSTGQQAANVFLWVQPDGTVNLTHRLGWDWAMETVATQALTPGDRELRLERAADLYTASYKDDNGDWQLLATTTVPVAQLRTDAWIGLAVTSQDNTQLATAVFDQVTMPWSFTPTDSTNPTNDALPHDGSLYATSGRLGVAITEHGNGWLNGDVTGDGAVDALDIDAVFAEAHAATTDANLMAPDPSYAFNSTYDLFPDGVINQLDVDHLIYGLLQTEYGDANLDGLVDALDTAILTASLVTGVGGWASGDTDGDGDVDSADAALQTSKLGFVAIDPIVIDASAETTSQIIYGRQGDDTLTGGQAADLLWGGAGDDQIDGGGTAINFTVAGGDAGDIGTGGGLSPGSDFDIDSLEDVTEVFVYGTDPTNSDTDNDGLNDGWEQTYFAPTNGYFDPLVPITPGSDYDADGLNDQLESETNSDPTVADTDGDGYSDLEEYNAGTDPTSDRRIPGEPRYFPDSPILSWYEPMFSWFGGPHVSTINSSGDYPTIFLEYGRDYRLRAHGDRRFVDYDVLLGTADDGTSVEQYIADDLNWVWKTDGVEVLSGVSSGSNAYGPTIDYQVTDDFNVAGTTFGVSVSDVAEIESNDNTEGSLDDIDLYFEQDVKFLEIDLDIDSDNSSGLTAGPDRDSYEDSIEGTFAKVIVSSGQNDSDGDGIPDYADGYGAFGPDSVTSAGTKFTPITLEIVGEVPLDASVELQYQSRGHPSTDYVAETAYTGLDGEIRTLEQFLATDSGAMRLWRFDGDTPRTVDDFIQSDTPYLLTELGYTRENPEITLYVEAAPDYGYVNVQSILARLIHPALIPAEGGLVWDVFADQIRVMLIDSSGSGLDAWSSADIEGFNVVQGDGSSTIVGSSGNDIIVGTSASESIDTGGGYDLVFSGGAPEGEVDEIFKPSGTAFAYLGSGDADLDLPEGSFWNKYSVDGGGRFRYSISEVLETYDKLFGYNNPVYHAFREDGPGAKFELRADTGGTWLGKLIEDDLHEVSDYVASASGVQRSIILHADIASPIVAAQVMHARMVEAIALAPAGSKMRELYNQRVTFHSNDLPTNFDDKAIWEPTYQAWGDILSTTAQFYLAGFGAINVGADIALAIADTWQAFDESGVYAGLSTATLGLFFAAIPGIPAGGKRLVKRIGGDAAGVMVNKIADAANTVLRTGEDAFNTSKFTRPEYRIDAQNFAFVKETAVARRLEEDVILYRYLDSTRNYSGEDLLGSGYLTEIYMSAEDARRLLALPNNVDAKRMAMVRLEAGTEVITGEVADRTGDAFYGSHALGGGTQVYVLDRSKAHILTDLGDLISD